MKYHVCIQRAFAVLVEADSADEAALHARRHLMRPDDKLMSVIVDGYVAPPEPEKPHPFGGPPSGTPGAGTPKAPPIVDQIAVAA